MLKPSRRRQAVVGVLKEEGGTGAGSGVLLLMPRDNRLPRMVVAPSALPDGHRSALKRCAPNATCLVFAQQRQDVERSSVAAIMCREAARWENAGGRTLVCAQIEGWESRHLWPAAKVRLASINFSRGSAAPSLFGYLPVA